MMKKFLLFSSVVALLALSSCNKTKYGDVTFWQATGSGFGLTVVSLDGVSSNISSEYGVAPSCGSSGCAVFNELETGTYNYSATDGLNTWSGTVTVTEGCTTIELF
jgi:hypothetical protein